MTDQTESEYAELLKRADARLSGLKKLFDYEMLIRDLAAAIRALEAKVHRLEVVKAGLWDVSRNDFATMSELRADREPARGGGGDVPP